MNQKFYTSKYDRVFKTIFCNEDNPHLLKELLSRTLKKNVEIVEFLRSELPVLDTIDKIKTVDVLAKVDGEYLHIELNCNYAKYLHIRNFIYFTNIYSRKVIRSEEYDCNAKFLHIDFTYGLNKEKDDVVNYYVMDNKNNKYIENFEIIEFNMDKITKYWYNSDKKKVKEYKHLIMLDLKKEDLEKISEGDEFVKEYEKQVSNLNNQETFRSFMSYEEDQKLIQNTEKKIAYDEGLEQGTKDGKIEIAKNMLKENVSIEMISKFTGLSLDEIKLLQE